MNHCNVNAILQLVRPSSWKSLSYIEVSAGDADVEPLRKRLRKLWFLNKYEKNHCLKTPKRTINDIKKWSWS